MKQSLLLRRGQVEVVLPKLGRSEVTRKKGIPAADAELTGCGVMLVVYTSMIGDPFYAEPKAAMLRFCQYLEQQRYGKPARGIFEEILKMNRKKGVKWIKSVCKKYVKDDNEMIMFVMNRKG